MHDKKSIHVIRTVAICTAVISLYFLPTLAINIWWEFSYLLQGGSLQDYSWWDLVWYVAYSLLFVLKIISAYGLFRIRPWARKVSIAVFSVDFFTRLYGIAWLYYFQTPETPAELNEGDVFIESFSLWPTIIIAFISLMSVIVLLQKPIKKVFNKALTEKHSDGFV